MGKKHKHRKTDTMCQNKKNTKKRLNKQTHVPKEQKHRKTQKYRRNGRPKTLKEQKNG